MKVKKDISWALAEEICNDLNAYLRDHDVWDLAHIYECDANWLTLMTDSFDGDWKHDHLRWDHLAEKFFKERYNIDEIDVGHEYTADTGGDWGPAYHYINLPVWNWALVNSEDAIPVPSFTLIESTKKGKKMKRVKKSIRDEYGSQLEIGGKIFTLREESDDVSFVTKLVNGVEVFLAIMDDNRYAVGTSIDGGMADGFYDETSDFDEAVSMIEDYLENPEYYASTKKGKKMKKNDDGVRIVDELNSLMDLASYFDEIRVKYGLPDNGMAWNDEAMLYDYIYDVRIMLQKLIDQINDMRENGGKRLE